jgi:hypothetical protein
MATQDAPESRNSQFGVNLAGVFRGSTETGVRRCDSWLNLMPQPERVQHAVSALLIGGDNERVAGPAQPISWTIGDNSITILVDVPKRANL